MDAALLQLDWGAVHPPSPAPDMASDEALARRLQENEEAAARARGVGPATPPQRASPSLRARHSPEQQDCDAALARRLQDEERALRHQQYAPWHEPPAACHPTAPPLPAAQQQHQQQQPQLAPSLQQQQQHNHHHTHQQQQQQQQHDLEPDLLPDSPLSRTLSGVAFDAISIGMALELVEATLSEQISKNLDIPTIGIGSGTGCDGQILVTTDLLGLQPWFRPSFVKPKADLATPFRAAVEAFIKETRTQ